MVNGKTNLRECGSADRRSSRTCRGSHARQSIKAVSPGEEKTAIYQTSCEALLKRMSVSKVV